MSRILVTLLSLLVCAVSMGCSAPPVQANTIANNGVTVRYDILDAGPVEWEYSPPYYVPFVFSDPRSCFFDMSVAPTNFTEGKPLMVTIQVQDKKTGYVLQALPIVWFHEELTKPIPPSASDRHASAWYDYQEKLSNYPPIKRVRIVLPVDDVSVAPMLREIFEAVARDYENYRMNVLDLESMSPRPNSVNVKNVDDIFREHMRLTLTDK